MALQSSLFRGDPQLEAAAQLDSAHVTPGSRGPHVGKIQRALIELEGARLTPDEAYGPATAAAVLSYKQKRSIINPAYQTQADNIVGKLTIASLDREMFARENVPPPFPPQPPPPPPEPPGPVPHLNLSFAMTDPSIYVTIEGSVTTGTAPARKAIDPGTFLRPGKTAWLDLSPVTGKTARFKVEKKGSIFWVIVFVPDGTAISHVLHVFFHPTPVQVYPDKKGLPPVPHVIADDKTYVGWGNDWRDLAQRYLNVMAPQLGAAKKIPLLIPMMRNAAAQSSNASNDVFADRPLETLYEIIKLAREKMMNLPADAPALPLSMQHVNIGTSSFSSGIAYHAHLFDAIRGHGSYLEAIDLDSTYITIAHPDISQVKGGPTIKRHTQRNGLPSLPNAVHFPPPRWDAKSPMAPSGVEKIDSPPSTGRVHHLIAEYTFFGAIQNSLLPTR